MCQIWLVICTVYVHVLVLHWISVLSSTFGVGHSNRIAWLMDTKQEAVEYALSQEHVLTDQQLAFLTAPDHTSSARHTPFLSPPAEVIPLCGWGVCRVAEELINQPDADPEATPAKQKRAQLGIEDPLLFQLTCMRAQLSSSVGAVGCIHVEKCCWLFWYKQVCGTSMMVLYANSYVLRACI